MNALLFIVLFLGLCLMGLNSICAFVSYSMAKKRGIKPFPAFVAALLGSLGVVFFIAMFPVKKEFIKFPKELDE